MEPVQSSDMPRSPEAAPGVPTGSFLQKMHPLAFAFFSLGLIFFLYQIIAGGITFILFGGKMTEANIDVVRWATVSGEILCILVPTVLLARSRTRNLVEYFRFGLPGAREIAVTVVGVFALQQMLQGYMAVQDAIPLPREIQHLVDTIKKMFEETYRVLVLARSPGEFIVVILTVALVPAISEEILFRGLVQRSFEHAVGDMPAVVMTGIIFGAYHLNPFSIVPLVALGVYFGFIVHRSRNITLAVSAHFFNNFIACAAIYLQMRDDFVVIAPRGEASSADLILNFALFALVFVAATYYFIMITDSSEAI